MRNAIRPVLVALVLTLSALPALADGKSQADAAVAASGRGDYDAVLKAAAAVPAGDPYKADALFCSAWAHAQKKETDKAIADYREVVKLRSDDAKAWNNLGAALDEKGDFKNAVEAYDRAIAAEPTYAAAWNNKGVALDKLGEGEKAAASFKAAIKMDANYAAPRNNLGAYYYESGDRTNAEIEWREAARIDPKYVSPIVNVSVLDFEGDRATVGEQRLLNLISEGRATAEVWFNVGVMKFRRLDRQGALEALEKADELRPNDPETMNNMGVIHMLDGNLRRAELLLRQATEKKPAMAKGWDNLGLTLYRAGRYGDARECFEKEAKLAPASAAATYNLGCALAADGKDDAAIAAFQATLKLAPSHVDAMHNLAVLAGGKKDVNPVAQRDLLEKVVKTDPNYAAGHLSLGRFYHTDAQLKDLDKAIEHYSAYVKLETHDPDNVAAIARTVLALKASKPTALK